MTVGHKEWSEEAYETLRACFEVTDWPALCEPHGKDIDGLTECITDYINFCVDVPVQCPSSDYNLLRQQ